MTATSTTGAPPAHHVAPRPSPVPPRMVADSPITLLGIRDTPLSLDEVHAAVGTRAAGGTALFIGTVRDHDGGRDGVTALHYSAHPQALEQLRRVAEEVCAAFPVLALAAVHRVGTLRVTDTAVIVAVSCAHRGDAFDAARRMIDDLKHTVAIWKHQDFADGTAEWVGTC